jgi:hypothetical protein
VGDLPFDSTVAYGCGHGCSPYAGDYKHDTQKTDFIMSFLEKAVKVPTQSEAVRVVSDAQHARTHARTQNLHRPDEGIEIGVGPSGVQTSSDELYGRCRKLSEEHGLVRHTHLLETFNQKKVRGRPAAHSLEGTMARKRDRLTRV